ncbi:hypothetical protein PENSPDRAFT_59705 [Peniophora sp. CONT]|nr:hypothetical protein PENSPDRAFT_59705 [Peniophora sp. CONT]
MFGVAQSKPHIACLSSIWRYKIIVCALEDSHETDTTRPYDILPLPPQTLTPVSTLPPHIFSLLPAVSTGGTPVTRKPRCCADISHPAILPRADSGAVVILSGLVYVWARISLTCGVSASGRVSMQGRRAEAKGMVTVWDKTPWRVYHIDSTPSALSASLFLTSSRITHKHYKKTSRPCWD